MLRFACAAAFALAALSSSSAEDKKVEPKGEQLKNVISVTHSFDKDKKTLTVTAVGQVPTGGWTGAKLTPRKSKDAPKDGIYEYDLTAVRPTGFVTQALSKVKAEHKWENPPADIKGVKVYGTGEGAKTVTFDK
ncbi:MAG: hypothetical protein FJ304_14780 [Planctomycetes bacterium]|nr:hypothetical protein [Planctomycetota bacterium]